MHINDVSLQLESGSLNVLLGPTLSGKTSLMRLMAGLDKPTQGDIKIDGKSVLGQSVRQRSVAMVYQQFINYPTLTVYENIASPMRIAGADNATIKRRVAEAAELLKLTDFLDRTPLNLSGGQQQRTALARALVKGAELVLLDEPLANLDYKLREELRDELPRLFAKTGAVLVYATTEPQEALLLGGSTATLSEGRVTQFGKTIDVYNQPDDLQTAQTFSDPPMNLVQINLEEGVMRFGEYVLGTAPDHLENGQYTGAIRPHHVTLAAASSNAVTLPATIDSTEITGSETFIHVSLEESSWVVLTHGVHRVRKGEALMVSVDPAHFYLFDSTGKLVSAPQQHSQAA